MILYMKQNFPVMFTDKSRSKANKMHFFVAPFICRDIVKVGADGTEFLSCYCCNALEESQMHSPDKKIFLLFRRGFSERQRNILELLQLLFLLFI